MTNQRRLLRKLGRLWEKHPELRFAQLVDSVAFSSTVDETLFVSPFKVADKAFEKEVDRVLEHGFDRSESE